MSALLLIPWFRLEPIVVRVGGGAVSVYPFQIAVGIAFIVIVTVSLLFARRHGESVEQTLNLAIYGLVFALPFALLFNALQHQPETLARVFRDPRRLSELSLRWSSYGGMMGGFIGAMLWKWQSKGSLFEVGDSFAFALPFGMFFARLGCFSAHDHPGRVSQFPLAVADFQTGAPPYLPRHDLGLYEAISAALVVVLLLFLSRSPRKPGFYVGFVATVYPLLRFFLDFLRTSEAEGGDARYFGLTLGQWVAPAIVVFGLLVMHYVRQSTAKAR